MGQLLGVAAPSPAPIAEPEPQAIAPRDEGLLQTLIAEANRLYQEQPLVLLMYLSLVFMYLQLMQQQKHQGKCMTALVEQLESHGAVAKAADDNDTDHHRIGAHRVNSDLLGTNLPQLTDDELDMHLQGVQPVMHEPPGAIFKNNVAVLRSINRETKRLQLYRGQAPGKFDRVWTSRPHDIAPGPVDLHCEMFDVADLVNQYKDVTGIQIPGDAVAMFNETWRAHLRSSTCGGLSGQSPWLRTSEFHWCRWCCVAASLERLPCEHQTITLSRRHAQAPARGRLGERS
eukprot:TRINITY_DN55028_c0_g2_i6.p1 TRINITY_DN55028_c0_g2~~TRINITY_DN55028_c0_g2_i6.p1  ORF type:complete len:287 (-),score=44.59 TRINITY_DN55028_c0_g2_i6:207-1067(-)